MIIDGPSASAFISGYTRLGVHLCGTASKRGILDVLSEARAKCSDDPTLVARARLALEAQGEWIDADVWTALTSMKLKQWIYLRDTKAYSVFLDPAGEAAYAVLGLTQPLRDILGGTGAVIETAVSRYRGRFVCDGIISNLVAWLGPNYRRDYTTLLAKLKARGAFHRTCPR